MHYEKYEYIDNIIICMSNHRLPIIPVVGGSVSQFIYVKIRNYFTIIYNILYYFKYNIIINIILRITYLYAVTIDLINSKNHRRRIKYSF